MEYLLLYSVGAESRLSPAKGKNGNFQLYDYSMPVKLFFKTLSQQRVLHFTDDFT